MDELKQMIDYQLKKKGIKNRHVLKAFEKVPRTYFVSKESKNIAYADLEVPITNAQTLTKPYIIAKMLELLEINPSDKVLEIGSGSGYVQALLTKIGTKTIGVENIDELAQNSKKTLKELKIKPRIVTKDGSKGLIEYHPFDKILISAAVSNISDKFLEQLTDFGIIVAPVGDRMHQKLTKIKKNKGNLIKEEYDRCIFSPLISKNNFN